MFFVTVYLSKALQTWTDDEMTDLLVQSRECNAGLGVTGLLVSRDNVFMQVLEGEEEVVRSLYRTIAADPRHRDVTNIWDAYAPRRCFAGWSMGFRNLGEHPIEVEGYHDLLVEPIDLRRVGRRGLVDELLHVLEPA